MYFNFISSWEPTDLTEYRKKVCSATVKFLWLFHPKHNSNVLNTHPPATNTLVLVELRCLNFLL